MASQGSSPAQRHRPAERLRASRAPRPTPRPSAASPRRPPQPEPSSSPPAPPTPSSPRSGLLELLAQSVARAAGGPRSPPHARPSARNTPHPAPRRRAAASGWPPRWPPLGACLPRLPTPPGARRIPPGKHRRSCWAASRPWSAGPLLPPGLIGALPPTPRRRGAASRRPPPLPQRCFCSPPPLTALRALGRPRQWAPSFGEALSPFLAHLDMQTATYPTPRIASEAGARPPRRPPPSFCSPPLPGDAVGPRYPAGSARL
mmetsp:Transcript_28144/g.61210  ORF Transcript_28144/g.61210 Transcript_28144/m.61210 type:complete len:260 (+) Transcript_28144:568-1347(+)